MKRILSLILVATAVLMVSALPASAITTMVVNGGFETGDFTGWTQSGNTGDTDVLTEAVNSGTYAARFGPVTNDGFISQDLATTDGQSYTISFWLKNGRPGWNSNTPNDFHLYWDGNEIFSLVNTPLSGYTQYSFVEQATSSSTTLTLGFQNDPNYFYVDDISVAPVPIPGALILFGSGLLGLVGVARNRLKR